jgi:antitoxin ParD1/3/4
LVPARVASGDFSSVEEAARQLLDERIAERMAEENDDLAWAKPYVDEAGRYRSRRSSFA